MTNNSTMFNEERFDDLVRNAMNGIEHKRKAPDWSAFEAKLDAAEATSDADFDATVQYKMAHFSIPYNPAHWDIMSRQIDEEFSLFRKLCRYKVVEASVLALAILTAVNVLDSWGVSQSDIVNSAKKITKMVAPTSIQQGKAGIDNQSLETPNDPATSVFPLNKNYDYSKDWRKRTPHKNNNTNKVLIGKSIVSTEIMPVSTMPTATIENQENTTKNTIITADNSNLVSTKSINVFKMSPIPTVMPMALTMSSSISAIDFHKIAVLQTKRNRWRIGTFIAANTDRVVAQFTSKDGGKIYSRTVNEGFGAGFVANRRIGAWEVETGLDMSKKTYTPVQVEKIEGDFDGYTVRKPQKVDLKVISLPLNTHYHFADNGKWGFYGIAGVNLSATTEIKYTEDVKRTNPSVGQPNRFVPESQTKGLIHGGSLKENFYMSANAGIGAEYTLNKDVDIFLEPMFQLQLGNGIGDNQDRLNTLTFKIGAKKKL